MLRQLGVPEHKFGARMPLYQDRDGVLHTGRRCAGEVARKPDLPIGDIVGWLCHGCAEATLYRNVDWLARVDEVPAIYDYAQRYDIPADPYKVRELLRGCQPGFDYLRDDVDLPGDARENLRRLLAARYDALRAALHTPAVAEQLADYITALLQANGEEPAGTELVVFGVLGYDPRKVIDSVVDTLVASAWRHHLGGGYFVCVAPKVTWQYLAHARQGMSRGTVTDAWEPALDAGRAAEAAAGLWDPTGRKYGTGNNAGTEADFSDLRVAYETAAAILEPSPAAS